MPGKQCTGAGMGFVCDAHRKTFNAILTMPIAMDSSLRSTGVEVTGVFDSPPEEVIKCRSQAEIRSAGGQSMQLILWNPWRRLRLMSFLPREVLIRARKPWFLAFLILLFRLG